MTGIRRTWAFGWASVRKCPPTRTRAARLLGRVWWSASAVEDVDLGDFAVSHREDGPRCIRHASRCATALPVAASHVEGAQRLSARPDMHTGASVKATPPGFNLLDCRQSIVEPVVDQKAAAEVPDKTTTLRFALPKRFLNPLPRLTQRNACDRIAGDDQPVLGCVELDGESPWLTPLAAWCGEEQPPSAAGAKSSTHNAATEATRRVIARECRPWRSKGIE